jgi:Cellulase (glycosyl hydrolase family 5)
MEEQPMHTRRWVVRLANLVLTCAMAASLGCDGLPFPRATGGPSGAGWTTRGVDILTPAGTTFVIAGVSWYGLETPGYALNGLNTRNYTAILAQSMAYQFNTVRIPISNEMWETNPVPNPQLVQACGACQGKRARDILAMVINYAGSIGLHVILDDHRSDAGSSTATNGLWYDTSGGLRYTEQGWINDWVSVQRWVHGRPAGLGAPDTVTVHDVASDGFPTVIGYDLRNEPHTPPAAAYLDGATWGTGDGINPNVNPNPNPFAPACVASSSCHDWRLAAERAGDTILGDAARNGWPAPLIFVQGISSYPSATGNPAHGPYDLYRWGGQLEGVNGNANNPGAPVVLNAGGTAARLGPAVSGQLVYTTRDYGPDVSPTDWFTGSTCYHLGCAPSQSLAGLVGLWCQRWAYIDLPPGRYGACTGGVHPHFHSAFPWKNTGATPYTQAPVWIGEFGTGNGESDLASPMRGSQGQWFTDLINFIQSSYTRTAKNYSGIPVKSLNWTYWALNSEDSYALLGEQYSGLANPTKQYSYLCFIARHPVARPQQPCGSTGPLPAPR